MREGTSKPRNQWFRTRALRNCQCSTAKIIDEPAKIMTRYEGLRVGYARLILSALVILVAYGIVQSLGKLESAPSAKPGAGDFALYQRISERVRNGESYYLTTYQELSSHSYATTSVFDFRLPTLAFIMAYLPIRVMAQWLLAALGFLNIIVWVRYWADDEKSKDNAFIGGCLLVGASLMCFVPAASFFHESWAGTLISISLISHAKRRWLPSVFAGLLALVSRELSLPFVLIMMLFAFYEGRLREALAWLLGLLLFFICFGIHASLVAEVTQDSAVSGSRWLQMGGWSFVLRTAQYNGFLLILPLWVTAIVLPLGILGPVGWPHIKLEAAGNDFSLCDSIPIPRAGFQCVLGIYVRELTSGRFGLRVSVAEEPPASC